jgi:hypothetical protein
MLTGEYDHESLSRLVGREIAHRILRQSHQDVFAEWLCCTLAEQKADLDEYLRCGGASLHQVAYRTLPPETAHPVERQLYLADLETLLDLLRAQSRTA